MSWLNFNARVLALAEDRRQPLLERMKFLAIFASNLDEFYMVRVAGLKRRLEMGLGVRAPDGLTTRESLVLIGERSRELVARHARCFSSDIEPALAAEGIRILSWEHLDADQQQELTAVLPLQDLSGAHPAGGRPGAPVPLHLRALAQPGGAGARARLRAGQVRPGEGAQQRGPVRDASARPPTRPASCPSRS